MNQYDDSAYAPTVTNLPRFEDDTTQAWRRPDQLHTAAYGMVPRDDAGNRISISPVQERPAEPKNGFGITTFICGIAGIVLSLVPILCIPALISGLVGFGFGWGATKRLSAKTADNKWMTRLGFALSILAIPAAIYGIYVVNKAVGDLQTVLNDVGATPAP